MALLPEWLLLGALAVLGWALIERKSTPMTSGQHTPGFHIYAELPPGKQLVPGDVMSCPGPDGFGICPLAETPSGRPCAGATWRYDGVQPWSFVFRADSAVCPVAVLDPLGPLPIPLD